MKASLSGVMGNVVFDTDGTLIDSMPQHADAFASAMFEHRGPSRSAVRDFYIRTAGVPLEDQFRSAMANFPTGDSARPSVEDLMEKFWRQVENVPSKAFTGVVELLTALNSAGYRLFAISGSTTSAVRSKLLSSGLAGHFELLLGSDSGPGGIKKGPAHLERIQMYLSASHDTFCANTILVGDAQFDVHLALEAGLLAAAVATTEPAEVLRGFSPDFIIQNTSDLLDLLRPAGRFVPVRSLRRTQDLNLGRPTGPEGAKT